MNFNTQKHAVLFSHAEMLKYVFKDFGGCYGAFAAEDFCQMLDAEAEVFGNEVAADIGIEGRNGTLNVRQRQSERFLMTLVYDNGIFIGRGRINELLLQLRYAYTIESLKM